MYWKRFYELWQQLLWWERRLLLWFGYLVVGRRAILPVMAWQAAGIALIVWLTPGNPLIWVLAYSVSFVYALMVAAWLKRLLR